MQFKLHASNFKLQQQSSEHFHRFWNILFIKPNSHANICDMRIKRYCRIGGSMTVPSPFLRMKCVICRITSFQLCFSLTVHRLVASGSLPTLTLSTISIDQESLSSEDLQYSRQALPYGHLAMIFCSSCKIISC